MAPLIIRAKDPRGCYGCGRPFARREYPVLDKLDRRWHMSCFLADRGDDPTIPPDRRFRETRRALILP